MNQALSYGLGIYGELQNIVSNPSSPGRLREELVRTGLTTTPSSLLIKDENQN